MKISWLSYQQGRWLFIAASVTSIAFAIFSVWRGDAEADLHVAGAIFITGFFTFVHFLGYYVRLGEDKTLVVRNGRGCRILFARDFAKIQPIRGFSFAVVLATGEKFRFAANPFDHYTSNFFPEHDWAAELTQRIKLHLT